MIKLNHDIENGIYRFLPVGTVIEFKDTKKDSDYTYFDKINSVNVYDNGDVCYWTDLFPESSKEPEIPHENVVAQLRHRPHYEGEIKLKFPYRTGQRIMYSWDKDKSGNTTYLKGTIKDVHFIIDFNPYQNEKDTPSLRITMDNNNYLCMEDDHEVMLLEDTSSPQQQNLDTVTTNTQSETGRSDSTVL